ncbi:MAG: right-handed parallel beta-helix repeat-containing protein [Deltaproteobacteria bacterium]|nr:right-handed parallel beta-helix repeat-containing protein [Deltaproteobacteria bacterium]
MKRLMVTPLALMIALLTFFSIEAGAQCVTTLLTSTTLVGPAICAGDGPTIGADDITLDCNGFTITGSGGGTGIQLNGRTGVIVENCTVANFAVGFRLMGSSSNYLTNNIAINNTSVGNGAFQLSGGSDGNVLEKNQAQNNAGRGFAVINSIGNMLIENVAVANGFRGIDLIDADGNALVRNNASQNFSAGVVIQGTSDGNILYRNQIMGNQSEGVASLSTVNYLSFNSSDVNNTYGFTDFTGGNFYLLNSCEFNGIDFSNPLGLCP